MLVPRLSQIFLIVNSWIYGSSIDKSSIDSKFKLGLVQGSFLRMHVCGLLFKSVFCFKVNLIM